MLEIEQLSLAKEEYAIYFAKITLQHGLRPGERVHTSHEQLAREAQEQLLRHLQ